MKKQYFINSNIVDPHNSINEIVTEFKFDWVFIDMEHCVIDC